MDINARCTFYNDLYDSIKHQINDGELSTDLYKNHLVGIRKDATNSNESIKKTASDLLVLLLSFDRKEINDVAFSLFGNPKCNHLHEFILNHLKEKIKDTININNLEAFVDIMEPFKTNKHKLFEVIEDIINKDLPLDTTKKFYLENVIPNAMSIEANNELRAILIGVASKIATIIPIYKLSSKEVEQFTNNVTTSYIKSISELRDKGYENWHQLWIFLIRYFGRVIHTHTDLTNKLLRVVEFAFRNSSYQQRLKGYECWKEFINNASSDINHLCSSKQIKLLITPLKAKISKQEVVICKRFEVFTFLLQKLQQKSVLVLKDFLEFCFGSLGDVKDGSKMGQVKPVTELWIKSIKVLIGLIGHSCNNHKQKLCIRTTDVVNFNKPVINHQNMSAYYQIVLNSIAECFSLLKELDIDERRKIFMCIWKSIIKIMTQTDEDTCRSCVDLMVEIIDNYIKEDTEYFNEAVVVIFCSIMSFNEEDINSILARITWPLLNIIFTVPSKIDGYHDAVLKYDAILHGWCALNTDYKGKILRAFCELKTKEGCEQNVAVLWRTLTIGRNISANEFEDHIAILTWPMRYYQEPEWIMEQCRNIFEEYVWNSDVLKTKILADAERIFNNNPLLSHKILKFVKLICAGPIDKDNLLLKIFKMLSSMLVIPEKEGHHGVISSVINGYFQIDQFASIDDEDIIKEVCVCVEHLLRTKDPLMPTSFNRYFKSLPSNIRETYSKYISPEFILNLETHDGKRDNSKRQSNTKPQNKADSTPYIASATSGRSAKIIAKTINKNADSPSFNLESPSTLRLFGKDPDTLSPLQVKGSQIKNVTPARTKRMVSAASRKNKNSPCSFPPPVDEQSSSAFVPIETEVKLHPEKLTPHQKESLRKRREDIPALYQDLSQSNTQDLLSSSNSVSQPKLNQSVTKDIESNNTFHDIGENVLQGESHNSGDANCNSIIEESPHEEKDVSLESNIHMDPQDITVNENTEIVEVTAKDINVEGCDDYSLEAVDSNIENEDEKERKKQLKIEAELKKLTMDIVGAEQFVSERRTRIKHRASVGGVEEITKAKDISPKSARRSLIEPKKTDNLTPKRIPLKPKQDVKVLESNSENTVENKPDESIIKTEESEVIVDPNKLEHANGNATPNIPRKKRSSKLTGSTKKTNTPQRVSTKSNNATDDDNVTKTAVNKTRIKVGIKKRKRSLSQEDSEDIIESSQESFLNTTPVFNTLIKNNPINISKSSKHESDHLSETSSKRKPLILTELTENDEISQKGKRKVKPNKKTQEANKKPQKPKEYTIKIGRVKKESRNRLKFNNKMQTVIKKIIIKGNIDSQETVINRKFNGRQSCVTDVDEIQNTATPGEDNLPNSSIGNSNVEMEIESSELCSDQNEKNPVQPIEEFMNNSTNISTEEKYDVTLTGSLNQSITEELPENENVHKRIESQDTETQETPSQDTLTLIDEVKIVFDLPEKPELTESQQMLCRMDTVSMTSESLLQDASECIIKSKSTEDLNEDILPSKNKDDDVSNKPGSLEFECVTPKKNIIVDPVEKQLSLLYGSDQNTPQNKIKNGNTRNLDGLPSSPITVDTPTRTSELLTDTVNISPISSQSDSEDEVPRKTLASTVINFKSRVEEWDEAAAYEPELEPALLEENKPSSKTHDVMEKRGKSPSPDKNEQVQAPKTIVDRSSMLFSMVNSGTTSPRLFIRKKHGLNMSPSASRIKKLMSGIKSKVSEELITDVKQDDILTFSREVPSPLAVPKSSILKRKYLDTTDEVGVSPCAKRKRVNFSDPCTTSKKVFIKDEQQNVYAFDSVLTAPKDLRELFDDPDDTPKSEPTKADTEVCQEIKNPNTIRKSKHIYPNLVDCKDDVVAILKKVASPMFITTLMNKLKMKNIKTIGDLAKQSETEVSKFPFKVPVIATVTKALDNYYQTQYKSKETSPLDNGEVIEETPVENSINGFENIQEKVISNSEINLENGELKSILTSSSSDNEDLGKNNKDYVKNLVKEYDFPVIIKHIIEKVGLPRVFEMLTEAVESSEDESVYFDCMIKLSIEKKPLSSLIETRSVQEIKNALTVCTKNRIFKHEDIIKHCVLPLIKEPADLLPYINNLTVVQIGDLVIQRLNHNDYRSFIDRIVKSRDESIVNLQGNKGVLMNRDVEDISDSLIEKWSPDEVVTSFQKCVNAHTRQNQKDIMVKMFRFINSKLSPEVLMDLHIEFLDSIRSKIATK